MEMSGDILAVTSAGDTTGIQWQKAMDVTKLAIVHRAVPIANKYLALSFNSAAVEKTQISNKSHITQFYNDFYYWPLLSTEICASQKKWFPC